MIYLHTNSALSLSKDTMNMEIQQIRSTGGEILPSSSLIASHNNLISHFGNNLQLEFGGDPGERN